MSSGGLVVPSETGVCRVWYLLRNQVDIAMLLNSVSTRSIVMLVDYVAHVGHMMACAHKTQTGP